MTKIELFIRGAEAEAEVGGPLTGGMVGTQVEIRYNSEWDGLSKTLVCRSCVDGTPIQSVRTIVNVGNQATVAHEVMIPGRTLYLGIEGRNGDGTVVFPTVWACCGTIRPGANADADSTVAATPEVWEQLLVQMGSLEMLDTEHKDALVDAINEVNAKRFVTSVNGVAFDENGNVEIAIPEGFSGSWNDLTDKPFGVDAETVVPETTVTFTEDKPVFVLPNFPLLIDGETYMIVCNGEKYETTAYYDNDMSAFYLEAWDDANQTGCPVIVNQIAFDGETIDECSVDLITEEYGTYTFSVTKGEEKTLDESYLPYSTEKWTFTLEDGSTVTKQVVVK